MKKPRNVFIHRALIAKLLLHGDNRVLAPRDPEKYPDWNSVFQVGNQQGVLERDFCEVGALANETINAVAATIDRLWEAVWEDSGTQLVQKLPARAQVRHDLSMIEINRSIEQWQQPRIIERRSFVSSCSASPIIINPSTK